jgi:hypothetical protein
MKNGRKSYLRKLERWITNNQTRVEPNGALLSICQAFLVSGVLTGVPAILGASFETFQQQDVQILILATIILYVGLILYLRSSFEIPK